MGSWDIKFGSKKPKVDGEVDIEGSDLNAPDVDIEDPNIKGKGKGFDIHMPSLPTWDIKFGGKKPKVDGSLDIDVDGPDIKGPNVDIDVDGSEVNAPDVDIKSPKVKGEGKGFDIHMPSFKFGGKKPKVSADVDIDGPEINVPDVDVIVPEVSVGVKSE